MTTLSEIIDALELKSRQKCNPSMDGKREAYYNGMRDAYLDCANILRKYMEEL